MRVRESVCVLRVLSWQDELCGSRFSAGSRQFHSTCSAVSPLCFQPHLDLACNNGAAKLQGRMNVEQAYTSGEQSGPVSSRKAHHVFRDELAEPSQREAGEPAIRSLGPERRCPQ